MELKGNWNYPTSIRFGAGRIRELPEACRSLGMRSPLLVTDRGLAALPMIGQAVASCREAQRECPTEAHVVLDDQHPRGRQTRPGRRSLSQLPHRWGHCSPRGTRSGRGLTDIHTQKDRMRMMRRRADAFERTRCSASSESAPRGSWFPARSMASHATDPFPSLARAKISRSRRP